MWILVECLPFFDVLFPWQKIELYFENQPNLDCNGQGSHEVPPSVCHELALANTEMVTLGFTLRCEYWWNACHSSMPVSWQTIEEVYFENQPNLECNGQGGPDVPPSGHHNLGWANTEKGPLFLTLRCEHGWNADPSSMPVQSQNKMNFPLKTNKISNLMTKEATRFLLVATTSFAGKQDNKGNTCDRQDMWILVECRTFFHASFMTKKRTLFWKPTRSRVQRLRKPWCSS